MFDARIGYVKVLAFLFQLSGVHAHIGISDRL